MKNVVVKKSKHGKGVFVNQDFQKDEIILRVNGKAVATENPQSFPADIQNHWFPFDKIGKINKYILPQTPWMYINHSCKPNVGFKSNRDVVAMRIIKKGEEIFFDYSMNNIDNWTMKCNCGCKNCRGIISTIDRLDEKTRDKYKNYILDCLKIKLK